MRRTLEMTVIEGIKTTIPLHLKILSDPDFLAGKLSTSFMERYGVDKKPGQKPLAESRLRPFPRLYPVVDVELSAARGWEPVDLARAFLEGGARLLQLRAKNLESVVAAGAHR